jgi:hypothetical protein
MNGRYESEYRREHQGASCANEVLSMFGETTEIKPDTLQDRKATAQALTDRGFKTKESSLATLASRGGGPIFRKYGQRVVYKWSDALAWALSRLSEPVASTSELDPERPRTLGSTVAELSAATGAGAAG